MSDSAENVEKVVSAPRKPVMRADAHSGGAPDACSPKRSPRARSDSRRATFAVSVPSGTDRKHRIEPRGKAPAQPGAECGADADREKGCRVHGPAFYRVALGARRRSGGAVLRRRRRPARRGGVVARTRVDPARAVRRRFLLPERCLRS